MAAGAEQEISRNIDTPCPITRNIQNKPLVLRTSTECQEAVDAGFAELVGVKPKKVLAAIKEWWDDGAKVPKKKSPFGDGKTAQRSVARMRDAGYC